MEQDMTKNHSPRRICEEEPRLINMEHVRLKNLNANEQDMTENQSPKRICERLRFIYRLAIHEY